MKKTIQIIIGIFAAIGVVYAVFVIVVMSGVWPKQRCTVYPVFKLSSPAGRFEAKNEQQRCSPENKLETIVWIHDNKTNSTWSVFTAKSVMNSTGSDSGSSGVTLKLKWLNENKLQIQYPVGTKVTQKLPPFKFKGILVTYDEATR